MSSGAIGASNFGTAILADANLRFPKGSVRLNGGMRIDVTPDALVISGPAGRQMLRCGQAKGPLVASVIRAGLDSENGVLDLNVIDHKVVGLLHAAGAIESVPDGDLPQPQPLEHLEGYLTGSRDSSRRFQNGADLIEFVARQRVHVAAKGNLSTVGELLAGDGVTVVHDDVEAILAMANFDTAHVLTDRLLDPRTSSEYCIALIPEAMIDGHKVAPGWLLIAAELNESLVRIALRTDRWFQSAPNLCDQCCERLIDTTIELAQEQEAGDLSVATALFTQELIDLLAQVNYRPADSSIKAITGIGEGMQTDRSILSWVAQEPPCADCHTDPGRGHRTQVAAFAALTEFAERHIQDPKGHQAHYLIANLAAQGRPRTLSSPTAAYATGWSADDAPVWLAPTLEAVRYAVGIREALDSPKISRYTASGGNMGSTAAIVEVCTPDGEASHYLYNDQGNNLVDVLTGDGPTAEPVSSGRASIHLIAGIGRLGPKYGDLGYRVAMADVGAALSTILEYARSQGFAADVQWARQLPDSLFSSALVGEGRHAVTVELKQKVEK